MSSLVTRPMSRQVTPPATAGQFGTTTVATPCLVPSRTGQTTTRPTRLLGRESTLPCAPAAARSDKLDLPSVGRSGRLDHLGIVEDQRLRRIPGRRLGAWSTDPVRQSPGADPDQCSKRGEAGNADVAHAHRPVAETERLYAVLGRMAKAIGITSLPHESSPPTLPPPQLMSAAA